MCGIAGYVGTHRPELLKPMCDAMAHRGPDDSGEWFDAESEVGFGHRRLSIIDLSPAGHQPMPNRDETIWITYNGEIYNFPEHRERLLAKGYSFRGESDTEVLLAMYEEKGIDCLKDLNGIFAFALWDGRERKLVLARDHAGIKPLYYRIEGRALYFASEIKALLRIPGIAASSISRAWATTSPSSGSPANTPCSRASTRSSRARCSCGRTARRRFTAGST